MPKVIVTTTINAPTEALQKFAAMPDWQLVVIGDQKTPRDFLIEGAIYVTPEDQEKYDPVLSAALGWTVVERRNYGFLWAKDLNADIVAVVDDGVGIDKAALSSLFDRFSRGEAHTTRQGHPSYGIGLSLVREIVQSHGGDIRVSSTPGQGATFTISLPAAPAPAANHQPG